jgi:hypothetical protein
MQVGDVVNWKNQPHVVAYYHKREETMFAPLESRWYKEQIDNEIKLRLSTSIYKEVKIDEFKRGDVVTKYDEYIRLEPRSREEPTHIFVIIHLKFTIKLERTI